MSDDTRQIQPFAWQDRPDEHRGTSTSHDEAALRDIGRAAFGIDYPRDVTPKRVKRVRETK